MFSDQGGILSRAGLGMVAVAGAAGSIRDVQTKTTVTNNGDSIVVQKETSGTVDQQQLANATKLAEMAGDPKADLSSTNGGLAANLEIAAQTLGGDTSGWQYDMGWVFRKFWRGSIPFGIRVYAGLGYGRFTAYERILDPVDRGPPMYGEGTTKFFGIPLRLGAFIVTRPEGLTSFYGTETFVKTGLNAIGPTALHVGQRIQVPLGYIEASYAVSGEGRSVGIEVGVGM